MPDKRPPTAASAAPPSRHVEIYVRGALGPITLEAFPALLSERCGPDTLLRGRLEDSAALYGVLSQLERLGLELLELRRVSGAARKPSNQEERTR